jgi:hypothetical protein
VVWPNATLLSLARDLACVLGDQDFRQLDDVLGLGVEQADRPDVLAKLFLPQFHHLLRCLDDLEQRAGRLVDADIRRLGRQHDRDQQGIGVGVFQFGLGGRIVGGKTAEEFVDVGGLHDRSLSPAGALRKGGIFTRHRKASYRVS